MDFCILLLSPAEKKKHFELAMFLSMGLLVWEAYHLDLL